MSFSFKSTKNQNGNKLNAILEPTESLKVIEVNINLEDKKQLGLLDTGSSRNYIETDFAETLKINKEETTPYEASKIITKFISCKLRINKENNSLESTATLNSLDSCDLKIILGIDFLSYNNLTLDLNQKLISLSGVYFKINDNKMNVTNELESELQEKAKILFHPKRH